MSDNGRFYIKDNKTGKIFCCEPIDNDERSADWGDVDPVTKKLTGHYGEKHLGSIREEDSIITEDNGFKNITYFTGSVYDGIAKSLLMDNKNK